MPCIPYGRISYELKDLDLVQMLNVFCCNVLFCFGQNVLTISNRQWWEKSTIDMTRAKYTTSNVRLLLEM